MIVIQKTVFTRRGVDRISKYAFEFARSRPRKSSRVQRNRMAFPTQCLIAVNVISLIAAKYEVGSKLLPDLNWNQGLLFHPH
jgi:isocitrate/isopropylmalate dehydrogenase